MLFSSPIFIFVFLPIVLFLICIGRKSLHNTILLIASLVFYSWGSLSQAPIFLFSIVLNYFFGIAISNKEGNRAKITLALAVSANLLMLGYFKYFNFFIENLNVLSSVFNFKPIEHTKVTLPIGISFFTFHALSYVIDVYRKKVSVQKNFFDLALYISFFPQLIAGPIVRYYDVATQFTNRVMNLEKAAFGMQRFVFGLSKKVIIANTLAYTADKIFNLPPSEISNELSWLGIICYTMQIYFDFSGYSDMAIGLAKIFGFDFPENFNYPYSSESIKEFWRRWHISLSTWFRDFLYIPLGGNRGSELATIRNLLIVFFCTGFWHGASWTFIVWGMYHGTFLFLERIGFEKLLLKTGKPIRMIYTFFVVIIGWVFFRADTLHGAIEYISRMLFISTSSSVNYFATEYLNNKLIIILIIACLYSFRIFRWLQQWSSSKFENSKIYIPVFQFSKFVISFLLLFLSCAYLAANTYNPFIYFRF